MRRTIHSLSVTWRRRRMNNWMRAHEDLSTMSNCRHRLDNNMNMSNLWTMSDLRATSNLSTMSGLGATCDLTTMNSHHHKLDYNMAITTSLIQQTLAQPVHKWKKNNSVFDGLSWPRDPATSDSLIRRWHSFLCPRISTHYEIWPRRRQSVSSDIHQQLLSLVTPHVTDNNYNNDYITMLYTLRLLLLTTG